jgi:hypothetical protein
MSFFKFFPRVLADDLLLATYPLKASTRTGSGVARRAARPRHASRHCNVRSFWKRVAGWTNWTICLMQSGNGPAISEGPPLLRPLMPRAGSRTRETAAGNHAVTVEWVPRCRTSARAADAREKAGDLEYDDSEPPAVGVVRASVPWEDVQDHIKIAHNPLLVPSAGGTAQYAGVYWRGTARVVAEDLGSDQEQAICDFRVFLRDRGEI